jgi:hypothetical protein
LINSYDHGIFVLMLRSQAGKSRIPTVSVAAVRRIVQQLSNDKAGLLDEVRQLRAAVNIYREVAEQLDRKKVG